MGKGAVCKGCLGSWEGWRWALPVFCMAMCGFLSCCDTNLKDVLQGWSTLVSSPTSRPRAVPPEDMLHVCLLLTSRDLRGAYVAIHSTVMSSSDPTRLHFHLLSPQWLLPIAAPLLAAHFGTFDATVTLHCSTEVEAAVSTLASGQEPGSTHPFLFVTLMLPSFLRSSGSCGQLNGAANNISFNARRLVYLSSDVVVKGDLLEFSDLDLGGQSVALGVDCHLPAKALIKASALRKLGLNAAACVPELGLVVVDVDKWEASTQLEQVNSLLRDAAGLTASRLLAGWLLVSSLGAQTLAPRWSCSNLGRSWMTMAEGWYLRQLCREPWTESRTYKRRPHEHARHRGFDHKSFQDLGISVDPLHGTSSPYLAACTDSADLLRFNGLMKPWLAGSWKAGNAPVCKMPLWLKRLVAAGHVLLSDKSLSAYTYQREDFVPCYELWKPFISPEVACSLTDVFAEWDVEEAAWGAAAEAGRKKKAEEAQAQEEREHEQQENIKSEQG